MRHKNFLLTVLFTVLFFSCSIISSEKEPDPSLVLWYDKPASEWTEALPLGNGRIGAMVYGITENEVIQFNEETLWSGQPHDYANPGAHNYLDQLRQLLWEGKQSEEHELGNRHFMSNPLRQLSYLPFGNVLLNFPGHKEVNSYQRSLDLETAISLRPVFKPVLLTPSVSDRRKLRGCLRYHGDAAAVTPARRKW